MPHFLVVDDSTVIRKVACKILNNLDFETSEADNGQTAIELCQRAMPDGVILDWNMPVMDGINFLRRLRSLPDGDKPTVIFCTTANDVQRISEALQAGANEYIMKPFDSDIFQAKLQQVGMI